MKEKLEPNLSDVSPSMKEDDNSDMPNNEVLEENEGYVMENTIQSLKMGINRCI